MEKAYGFWVRSFRALCVGIVLAAGTFAWLLPSGGQVSRALYAAFSFKVSGFHAIEGFWLEEQAYSRLVNVQEVGQYISELKGDHGL